MLLLACAGHSKGYPILDPGDPDLSQEKKDSKSYKPQKEINVRKPFIPKNPNTTFERGILRPNSRICFVGDSGNGSLRQRKIAALMQKNCDQIRHLGDLLYYVGAKNINDPVLKSRFFDVYNSLTIPMFITLGNHDYYQNPDLWLEVGQKFPNKYIFPNNYYLDLFSLPKNRGLCFITLDSTPFNELEIKDGINTPRIKAQLTWLNSLTTLIKNRCTFTMSFMHHPLILSSAGRDEKNSDTLVLELYYKRILKFVDFVVAGHDHFLSYYPKLPKLNGGFHDIPEIISGTGGMLNTEKPIENRPFGQVFRENGFVIMTLRNASDNPTFSANFRFIDHNGKDLLKFDYSK